MSLEGFVYLHNQYVDGYFIAVYLCLLLPLYAGVILLVIGQNEEKRQGRKKLKVGVILTIMSVIMVYAWKLVYYTSLYEKKEIYIGAGDQTEDPNNNSYNKYSKKSYIMEQSFITLALLTL